MGHNFVIMTISNHYLITALSSGADHNARSVCYMNYFRIQMNCLAEFIAPFFTVRTETIAGHALYFCARFTSDADYETES